MTTVDAQGSASCPDFPEAVAKAVQAGVLATQATIQHQYVNIGGELRTLQSLPTAELVALRERIYRASRRYENRAAIPWVATAFTASVAITGIHIILSWQHQVVATRTDRLIVLFLVAMVSVPIWVGMYDMRRRNRLALKLAERRWADVAIELDSRADAPVTLSRGQRLIRWMKKKKPR